LSKIIQKTRKRELIQLWIIASHYFSLSKRLKNKLNSKQLKLTLEDIAKLCNNKPKITSELKRIMLITAHLSSSALRLNTIDEIFGLRHSKRWAIYKNLEDNSNLNKTTLHSNSDKIIHILLRHGVGHAEPSPVSARKQQYIEMKEYLDNLTIKQIYTKMETVLYSIEKDLSNYSII